MFGNTMSKSESAMNNLGKLGKRRSGLAGSQPKLSFVVTVHSRSMIGRMFGYKQDLTSTSTFLGIL